MKKLSNILKESVWSDMHRRSNGDEFRKEDVGILVTIDGVKYNITREVMTLGEDYVEDYEMEWDGFGFDKSSDNTIRLENNCEFVGHGEYCRDNHDIYVLRQYIEKTPEEHIKEMMEKGYVDTMNNHPIQKILEDYLKKIYTDNHMSEYAEFVLNDLSTSDFLSNICFEVSAGIDYCPDDVEYDKNDILDANTIFYPVIDGWREELENDLREAYTNLGWVESTNHEMDPFESPSGADDLCFLKLKEGAQRTDDIDDEDDDEL